MRLGLATLNRSNVREKYGERENDSRRTQELFGHGPSLPDGRRNASHKMCKVAGCQSRRASTRSAIHPSTDDALEGNG